MVIKLRILRGSLKDRSGNDAGGEIVLRWQRFLIGAGTDCHLRCASKLINKHHCTIEVEADRIVLRNHQAQIHTYLNNRPIDGTACLFHGDKLRIGKLEFEILVVPAVRMQTIRPIHRLVVPQSARDTVVAATDTVLDLVAEKLAGGPLNPPRRRPTTTRSL